MSTLERWETWVTEYPGSTRGVALMRIGIALIAWCELGSELNPREVGWFIGLCFFASTALMLVGFRSQIATFAAGVCFWVVLSKVPNTMHHHSYLMASATTCLALTPCGKSFSVDRWLAVRAARAAGMPPPDEHGNLWAVRLIGLQLSAVFFWGGYNKLTLGGQSIQTAFLHGDRLEQTLLFYHSFPAHPPNWLSFLFGVGGTGVVAFELFAGIGLWIPKTRPYVLVGCLLMTTSFQILLSVGTFGVLAAVLYLAFVPPDRVHRLIDDLAASPQESA